MIGQTKLRENFTQQVGEDRLPKFVLLIGAKGSGRKTLADWLFSTMKEKYPETIRYFMEDGKADTVRQMISDMYFIQERTMCILPDIDNLSVSARNALLKITEEPPKDKWFVMTAESEQAVLDTILSRATVYHMNYYTPNELREYLPTTCEDAETLLKVCSTPGDINTLSAIGVDEFMAYVEKVVQNIDKVSGSNSFKIAEKLAVKSDKGYDLSLFWRAFMLVCFDHLKENPFKYTTGINITTKYFQELRNPSLNKQMCFDNWLLDIRQGWFDYAECD